MILSRNEILTITKGHNCVVNLEKLTGNNPDLDPVNINVYAKLGQIPSICSKDIEWKRNFDNNLGPKWCGVFVKIDDSNLDLVNVNAYGMLNLV